MKEKAENQPFLSYYQYENWKKWNCNRCINRYRKDPGTWHCRSEHMIDIAAVAGGGISQEIADKIGFKKENGLYIWICPSMKFNGNQRKKKVGK